MPLLRRLVIPLIIIVVTFSSSNIQWTGNHWKNIVEADGKGYYAYLPAIFIYKDLNFSFFDSVEKKHPNSAIFYDYRANCNGKICNKYFAGTALAMSPFFLAAHFISTFFSAESDGYSKIYLVLINIAAIFYLWIGLFYFKRILLKYTDDHVAVNFIIVVTVFATNLFYYVVREPSMSHIYSFAFISAFIYYSIRYFEDPQKKLVVALAFLIGFIILIRPVNGIIVLLLPFLAGDFKTLKAGCLFLIKRYYLGIFSFVLFVSIISIQFLIYKIQTGHFFVDTYIGESFNWTNPHPIDFLFSYKKGLFVYAPVLLLCAVGVFDLFMNNRFKFYAFVFFILLLIYVLSSWWNWWYGGSFGTRVMVEYYSIFAILLLLAFKNAKLRIYKYFISTMFVAAMVVCQIQTYQYRYYHIHWEKMDKEHYWRNFLRIDLIEKENNLNKDLLTE